MHTPLCLFYDQFCSCIFEKTINKKKNLFLERHEKCCESLHMDLLAKNVVGRNTKRSFLFSASVNFLQIWVDLVVDKIHTFLQDM